MICETCGLIVIKHTKQQDVIDAVLTYFDVDFHYLKTRSRKREIVYPRQVMMYFLKSYTGLKLKEITSMFRESDKQKPMDHTSVIHSCHAITDLMFSDPGVRKQIEIISGIIMKHNVANEALMYKFFEND